MPAQPRPVFSGGLNIALKIPKVHFERTVAFYRDVLGFDVRPEHGQPTKSCSFAFGPNRLWLDCVDVYAQTDVWLELTTDDVAAATEHLRAAQVPIRDELEPLPPGMSGHWISNPAGIVHLLCTAADSATVARGSPQ